MERACPGAREMAHHPGATRTLRNRSAVRSSARQSRRKILDCLHRLYAVRDVARFPQELMSAAEELVPCFNISFDSVNLQTGEATNMFDRPISVLHGEFLARWQSFCHEHPGIAFLKNGGQASVFSITDFITQREFRKTGFYQEFFHPISGTHQLGIILPVPGFVVGMALNRDADFGVYERELMEDLQPHFAQAYQHAQIFTSLQARPETNYEAWRRRGLTLREAQVLEWVAEGKRNAEIATILSIRTRTVGKHVENIFAKLGVETRAAAAAEARRLQS